MTRVFLSTVVGVLLGIGIGLGVGWGFPPAYTNSTLPELARTHQDSYTVMIASGYVNDRDLTGALQRLQLLGVDNVPAYVQELAERYITNSSELEDIRVLVALADGFGRATPLMDSFCQFCADPAPVTPATAVPTGESAP
ncbi:MAG: hypothetical protein AAFV98_09950 [Chloroflexota bacterium]